VGWKRVVVAVAAVAVVVAVVVVGGDEIGGMEGRGCGRELDRFDVEGGDGGMRVGKMGFEGRMKGLMHKRRKWTADDTACAGTESNIVEGSLVRRRIAGFVVLEESDIAADGTVVAVAVVVVVVVVASG